MRYRLLMVASVWIAISAGLVGGQPSPRASSTPAETPVKPLTDEVFHVPLDDETTALIDGLIAQLGSPQYKQREIAAREIIEIGLNLLAPLRRAYHRTDELEVRLRIEEIVQRIYLNHHVYDRNGFLGITMMPFNHNRHKNAKVPENTVGVLVTNVVAKTAAARAGLQKNDVIVAVDGMPLAKADQPPTIVLSKSIRSHPPGATMSLTLVRASGAIDVKVTLGRCPDEVARRGNVIVTSDLARQASARFPAWWEQYFKTIPVPRPANHQR